MDYQAAHQRTLERLAANPQRLNPALTPENILTSSIEPRLYDDGKLLTQPDLIFWTVDGEVYIYEFKGDGNGKSLRKAERQVNQALVWFGRYTPVSSTKIYTEVLTRNDPRIKGDKKNAPK